MPSSSHLHFESVISSLYPSLASSCSQFLRHKDVLIKPSKLRERGVPVLQGIQREGEFMITFPCAYHQGFNMGFNLAESVNFAVEEWLEWGEKAEVCQCRSTSVNIDVQLLKDKVRQIREARQTLVERGLADDELAHAPLSMDLINSSPQLRAVLDAIEANSTEPIASGQRSMVALAAGKVAPVSVASDAGAAEPGVTGAESEGGSGEEEVSAQLEEAVLVDDDLEEVTYEEDCIPEGVSVALRCGYNECEGQFRNMKSLLRHYQTAHSGSKTSDTAAQGRRRRGRGGDREEEDDDDFRSKRKRNSGRAKRRRRGEDEEEAEDEEAVESAQRGTVAEPTVELSLRELLRRKAEKLRLGDRWKHSVDPVPPVPQPSLTVKVLDKSKEDAADCIRSITQHRTDVKGDTLFQVTWKLHSESTWEPLPHGQPSASQPHRYADPPHVSPQTSHLRPRVDCMLP